MTNEYDSPYPSPLTVGRGAINVVIFFVIRQEEDDDEEVVNMTSEEIDVAKSFLKDRVKDQVQVLLDEARESVEDKVNRMVL